MERSRELGLFAPQLREPNKGPEEPELPPLEEVRSEVNLLLYPFFALNNREMEKRTETEFRAIVERDGKRLEISWNVSANAKYGYPGPFDKKVHKAIEQIIEEQVFPIQNPIRFTTYDICKRVGINTGGSNYEKVKEALERIKFTGIRSEGTFYHKGRKEWISKSFNLYSDIIFKGSQLPDGTIAETNLLFLSNIYLESLNARYVKPLDFSYYKSLSSNVARRLYELLGVKFYGALNKGLSCVSYRYSTLCQLLPLVRYTYPSYVKRQLEPAHQELRRTGFLEKVVWERLDEDEGGVDWIIHYYAGKRAKEEAQRYAFPEQLGAEVVEPVLQAAPDERSSSKPRLGAENLRPQLPGSLGSRSKLLEDLKALGVTEKVAEELVRSYDQEHIKSWLAAIGHVKAEDRAAYLVKAIREGWALPEAYKRALRKRELEEQRRQAEEAERRKREEELKKWAAKPLEEKVQEALERWLMIEKAFNRQPSEEAIAAKREELIKYYQSTAPRSSSSGS
jgi:hypothetical protein